MTYPPPNDPNHPPDPTRAFPAPPQYDPYQAPPVSGQPYQAPPVVSGTPYQPVQAYGPPPGRAYPPPPQPYGAPPPGFYPPQPPPKKGMGPGKVVVIVVGAVLGICVLGSIVNAVAGKGGTTKTAATQAPATQGETQQQAVDQQPATEAPAGDSAEFNLKPGTTLTLTGDDGSEQDTTIVSLKTHKGACTQFGTDPDNGSYLIAEVRVEQKKGTGSVNPLFFGFVGADGTTSNTIGGAFSGCAKNTLDSTNSLRAGSKRSGQVVFDVKSAKGTVEFTPGLGEDTVGSWKAG